MMISRLH